ncbi:hypothetical protein HK096_010814 [Nowakowskiella sp. JEL0078]|nr:hypothetical protein HK096_010814 [Nowakowskiella sp. JEL0078]
MADQADLVSRYSDRINEIIKVADLTVFTFKDVRLQIEKEFSVSLRENRKEFDAIVRNILTAAYQEDSSLLAPATGQTTSTSKSNPENQTKESETFSRKRKNDKLSKEKDTFTGLSDAEYAKQLQELENSLAKRSTRSSQLVVKKRKKSEISKKKIDSSKTKDSEKPKKLSGIQKPKLLSIPLADLLGVKELARTMVVKGIWDYIKANGLKDPKDGRYFQCDDKLKAVFGVDRLHAFGMNKYISAHMFDRDELVEGTPRNPKPFPETADLHLVQAPIKLKTLKDPNGSVRTAGLAPMCLSEPLAAICGTNILARTKVVQKLWEYVRENNLKDPENATVWICDDKLKCIFGVDRIDGFKMNKVNFLKVHSTHKNSDFE